MWLRRERASQRTSRPGRMRNRKSEKIDRASDAELQGQRTISCAHHGEIVPRALVARILRLPHARRVGAPARLHVAPSVGDAHLRGGRRIMSADGEVGS
eukprot:6174352-Pleurochrysis_carterae.AAC.1